jgi:hypothetical protein
VDPEHVSLEVLAERIRNREIIERAIQLDLHDLGVEFKAILRQDYMTAAEMRNHFVTRAEIHDKAVVRREWPVVLASVVVAATAIVNSILLLTGGH